VLTIASNLFYAQKIFIKFMSFKLHHGLNDVFIFAKLKKNLKPIKIFWFLLWHLV